jgi:hypothetical protein
MGSNNYNALGDFATKARMAAKARDRADRF